MISLLKSLLECNFSSVNEYLAHEEKYNVGFPRSSKLWRWCKSSSFCTSPYFLSSFCSLFPRLIIKVLRLQIGSSIELLKKGLVDRALLLVRDPRATMYSRCGASTNMSYLAFEQEQSILVLRSGLCRCRDPLQRFRECFHVIPRIKSYTF